MGQRISKFIKGLSKYKPKSKSLTLDSCGLSIISLGIALAVSIPLGIVAFGISCVVLGAIIND